WPRRWSRWWPRRRPWWRSGLWRRQVARRFGQVLGQIVRRQGRLLSAQCNPKSSTSHCQMTTSPVVSFGGITYIFAPAVLLSLSYSVFILCCIRSLILNVDFIQILLHFFITKHFLSH